MKTNQPTDNRIEIIREAFKRIGVGNDHEISKETGITYDRLHKSRMRNPDNLTIGEFKLLQRHGIFTDAEVLEIAKERREL